MKKILLVSLALGMFAAVAAANPLCQSGTLAFYEANYNGSNACSIGELLFSDFSSLSISGNTPADINIVVLDSTANPGQAGIVFSAGGFTVVGTPTAAHAMDERITYNVSYNGPGVIDQIGLKITGFRSNPPGTGTGVVTESLTTPSVPSLVTSVATAALHSQHEAFADFGQSGVASTTVNTDVSLNSPVNGKKVSISIIEEDFAEITSVPEPYGTVLIGSGLLVLGWRRKRPKN